MGRKKAVNEDLLADIPDSVNAQPAQTQPQPKQKPKRLKKAQPKATSEKTPSAAKKRPAKAQPSESTRSKRLRSSSVTTLGPLKYDSPWAPPITIDDKPVKAGDSANDIEVGVALSAALLLLEDLNRKGRMSEYENFALMLQHSVQELADKTREVSNLQKTLKKTKGKIKTLSDQAEAAIKAKDKAEEKADAAEAIAKVLEAQKKEAEKKMVEAQKELQDALAIKEAEIKAADERAYAEGAADVKEDYKKQVKQEAARFKSPTPNEQVLNLTQDEEGEVPKNDTPEKTTSDVSIADKSIDQTLKEIDAELSAKKDAENNSQMSSEPHPTADAQ
ncbi:dynactin subunit 1-like [Camellia sinensis]|uniref:dynactin subunit 1-like n=1 Tax=Camellia sinensis TaxID=4442 RepID=UPI0010355EB7|nr:dynactin subunit 1-like [Camellia sinensis]